MSGQGSSTQIQQFDNSTASSALTPDQLADLNSNDLNAKLTGDGQTALSAFSSWNTDQTNAQTTWQNYASLVAKEGGGEGQGTILGNANQITPYQSILAGQQGVATIGNPPVSPLSAQNGNVTIGDPSATPSTLTANKKRLGAP